LATSAGEIILRLGITAMTRDRLVGGWGKRRGKGGNPGREGSKLTRNEGLRGSESY